MSPFATAESLPFTAASVAVCLFCLVSKCGALAQEALLSNAPAVDLTTYVSPNVSPQIGRFPCLLLQQADHNFQTGDAGGGNTFPGVTWPAGIVKLGPDLYEYVGT